MAIASLVLASVLLAPCRPPHTSEPARCGSIEVWEDRGLRSGRRIPISIVVFPARAEKPEPDPLFVIAGGPGQSATEFAGLLVRDFAFAHARRDVVFIDQRGTGGSNALHCRLGDTLDEVVQAIAIGVDADLATVDRCRRELERKADLRLYTTPIAVDDLEDVRAALGYERINLFGASYGSRAALVYMRRYPHRVRSAILRGVAGPELVLPLTVLPDGERALHRLLGACDVEAACRAAYPMLEQTLTDVLTRLQRSPVVVKASDPRTGMAQEVRVDGQVFGTTLFFLLFATDWAKDVPAIVHAAGQGDFGPFADALPLIVVTALPVHWGMRRSVLCSEDVTRTKEAEVRAITEASLINDPSNLGLLASCERWPKGALPDGYFEPVASDVPVLAISGVEDPVLPPHRAETALRRLPNAVHLIVPGTAHGPTFPACVAELADRFLGQGSGKGLDTTCVGRVQRPAFTIRRGR